MLNNFNSNGLLLFFGLLISANAQYERCKTPAPDNFDGRCISRLDCKIVADILEWKPENIPPRVQQFLTKAECGNFNGQKFICCANHHINQDNIASRLPADDGKPDVQLNNNNIDNHQNLGLLSADCGTAFGDKISNANLTELFEFQFMALLQYESTEGLRFLCGGTLISPQYVLTAAHCVVGRDGRRLRFIRLGEHNYNTDRDCDIDDPEYCADPYQDIPVEETIPHDGFNTISKTNDIALVRLRYPANLKVNNVVPICLPTTPTLRDQSFQTAIVSGWGTTEKGSTSSILLKATIPIIERNVCQKNYQSEGITIGDSHLCAGGENRVDTCKGDSGGPLFYSGQIPNIKTPRYIQYGVVSAGPACNESDVPSLYTKVSYYMKWILDNLKR